jgi:hypothetical protein
MMSRKQSLSSSSQQRSHRKPIDSHKHKTTGFNNKSHFRSYRSRAAQNPHWKKIGGNLRVAMVDSSSQQPLLDQQSRTCRSNARMIQRAIGEGEGWLVQGKEPGGRTGRGSGGGGGGRGGGRLGF